MDSFLNIDAGGHSIVLDCRNDHYRVNCNGATHAQFSRAAMGDIAALKSAVLFAEQVEAKALMYPKPRAGDAMQASPDRTA